jgi:hypothetical protein
MKGCPACRGTKTVMGMGCLQRIPCSTCKGEGQIKEALAPIPSNENMRPSLVIDLKDVKSEDCITKIEPKNKHGKKPKD